MRWYDGKMPTVTTGVYMFGVNVCVCTFFFWARFVAGCGGGDGTAVSGLVT